jgi:hypothetical protein
MLDLQSQQRVPDYLRSLQDPRSDKISHCCSFGGAIEDTNILPLAFAYRIHLRSKYVANCYTERLSFDIAVPGSIPGPNHEPYHVSDSASLVYRGSL